MLPITYKKIYLIWIALIFTASFNDSFLETRLYREAVEFYELVIVSPKYFEKVVAFNELFLILQFSEYDGHLWVRPKDNKKCWNVDKAQVWFNFSHFSVSVQKVTVSNELERDQ